MDPVPTILLLLGCHRGYGALGRHLDVAIVVREVVDMMVIRDVLDLLKHRLYPWATRPEPEITGIAERMGITAA